MTTLSSATRFLNCPTSEALPRINETSVHAEAGSSTHDEMESEGADAISVDTAGLPVGPEFARERTFAIDVISGKARVLGDGLRRDYSAATDSEIPGTADVVSTKEEALRTGTVVVRDYKTGRGWQPKPDEHGQLLGLAVAAARAYGVRRANVGLIYIHGDGSHHDGATADLDALDLDAAWSRIRGAIVESNRQRAVVLAGGTPDVSVGEWCRYCPGKASCPAQTRLLLRLLREPVTVAEEHLEQLTPATAAKLVEWEKHARDALGRVRRALVTFAESSPIQMPDGQVFGPHETERREVDGPLTYQVLEGLWGAEYAQAATERVATIGGIDEAVKLRKKALANGSTLKALREEVHAALAKAARVDADGKPVVGLSVKYGSKTELHRPKRGAAGATVEAAPAAANESNEDPFARSAP